MDDLVDILEQITDLVRADQQIHSLRLRAEAEPRNIALKHRLLEALTESGTPANDPEVIALTQLLARSKQG